MYMSGMDLRDIFDALFNHTAKLKRDIDQAVALPCADHDYNSSQDESIIPLYNV